MNKIIASAGAAIQIKSSKIGKLSAKYKPRASKMGQFTAARSPKFNTIGTQPKAVQSSIHHDEDLVGLKQALYANYEKFAESQRKKKQQQQKGPGFL